MYKKEIEDFEKKTQILEREKESILKEKESIQKEKDSILKKLQNLLEKFSSIKFELSQLKRLLFGSKRERFVSNGKDGQMTLPCQLEALPVETEPTTEKIAFTHRKANRQNHHGRLLTDHLSVEEIFIEHQKKGCPFRDSPISNRKLLNY